LSEAGVPLDGASDHGVSEALYLRDPDQNGVEIPIRTAWSCTGTVRRPNGRAIQTVPSRCQQVLWMSNASYRSWRRNRAGSPAPSVEKHLTYKLLLCTVSHGPQGFVAPQGAPADAPVPVRC
jgi:hypothetical protein